MDSWIPSTHGSIDPWIYRADFLSALWIYQLLDSINTWIYRPLDLSSWFVIGVVDLSTPGFYRPLDMSCWPRLSRPMLDEDDEKKGRPAATTTVTKRWEIWAMNRTNVLSGLLSGSHTKSLLDDEAGQTPEIPSSYLHIAQAHLLPVVVCGQC